MFYTYILASQRNGTLYIGHTDNLYERVRKHKARAFDGFTAKYGVNKLVYWEGYATREAAFVRERRMKEWKRAWKLELIERFNPGWEDRHDPVLGIS